MAAVQGNSSRAVGSSDCELKYKFKRKRRRRCKSKGRSNTLSTIISPMRNRDFRTSAEDGDKSGTSGLEVKENHDHRNQPDCALQPKTHPSTFCTTIPRGGTKAMKRKQPLVDGKDRLLYQNQLTYKRAAWTVTQKNALVQLNEIQPGLQYEMMSKTGPLHAPVFSISVEVNGLQFEGQGPTKKQAKMRAAELALKSFIQFPNTSQADAATGTFNNIPMDFTTDKLDIPGGFLKEFEPSSCENYELLHRNQGREGLLSSVYHHRRPVRLTVDLLSSANSKRTAISSSILEQLGPVALLSELFPGLRYVCLSERVQGRPVRSFVMVVWVEGRIFEGCGRSKRLAKAQAAAAALQALYKISLGTERTLLGDAAGRVRNQLPQCFAESIFQLVREKYTELTDCCCSTSHGRHKVLAGIVMTSGFDLRHAQVVSLGTGTKCLSGERTCDQGLLSGESTCDQGLLSGESTCDQGLLSGESTCDQGLTVNDCHAEVIVRRAFIRFLYSQLDLLLCKRADSLERSIFVPNKGCGYRLRDGVHFHMYVSSSPCGDARLNCPYEITATHHNSHRLVTKFRCHLRTKMEGGEGTLPVTAQRTNQKWDGMLPGKPLVTMSCTDKMARWNVVGLQGALLSCLVEPVYLHSLSVGTLCHTGHLGRALARRLGHVSRLPFPYRRNQLLLGGLSSSDGGQLGRSSNVSLNWSGGDRGLEELSCSTGRRRHSGTPSQLCKHSLFVRWQRLHQQLNRQASGTEDTVRTYSGSKMAAGPYQRARQQFAISLQESGLGTWTRKPPDLEKFHVSL